MTDATSIVESAIREFSTSCSDMELQNFLQEHQCIPVKLASDFHKNAKAIVSVMAPPLVLIYDDLEEEYGIALLLPNAERVSDVELVGSFAQSLREMKLRTDRAQHTQ